MIVGISILISIRLACFRFVVGFLLGFACLYITCVRIDLDTQKIATFYDQKTTICGVISQDIIVKEGTFRVVISGISLNYSIETQKSQAYLMLDSTYADFARSDSLCVVGTLKEGFGDYNAFMYRPQLITHSKPSPPDLALLLKTTFASHLREALQDDDISNLSLGYLVGEKGQMVDDFKDNLKRVGMTHAVVASGFHLSVLIGFAKRYLKKISRFCALFGSILLLFLFVSIAGFSPSLARAGIVTLLSLLA